MTFLKRKVVHAEYARCGARGKRGGMSAAEQGVTTHGHGTPHTLTCAGLPSEGEREGAKLGIEPTCPLCGHRNQMG